MAYIIFNNLLKKLYEIMCRQYVFICRTFIRHYKLSFWPWTSYWKRNMNWFMIVLKVVFLFAFKSRLWNSSWMTCKYRKHAICKIHIVQIYSTLEWLSIGRKQFCWITDVVLQIILIIYCSIPRCFWSSLYSKHCYYTEYYLKDQAART